MKYVAVPSLIKRETNGVLPHPVRLARICFTRVRPTSVVCVISTEMLRIIIYKGGGRMRKLRLALSILTETAVLKECNTGWR
jgi:hypothetical protein